jgi:dTDP-4-dehydrorhamnose reductase
MTPFQMAISTAAFLSLNSALIKEVNASTFSQPGKRPLKTGFAINKARNELGYEPLTFTEGLQRMFAGNAS